MVDTLDQVCSLASREAGEPMFGTAKPTVVWLLMEYDGRWQPEALDDSALPEPVKTRLQGYRDTIPQTQPLLIRQRPRLAPPGIAFYVGLGREHDPALYEFHLDDYGDLLALDIPAIIAGDPAYDAQRRADPLLLVCTHGRRDQCCARYGIAIYDQITAEPGAAVWQVSHIGGHRFAANVITLPHGLYYGRVELDRVPALLAAERVGKVVPDMLRGRACYPQVVQAADYYLRAESGVMALDAYRLVSAERGDPDQWIVRFASRMTGETHELVIAEDPTGTKAYASCGDAEPSLFSTYTLLRYEVVPAVG